MINIGKHILLNEIIILEIQNELLSILPLEYSSAE